MSEIRSAETQTGRGSKQQRRAGWKKQRVVFRVERFSEPLRALVDHGLAQGKSFRQIREEVEEAGEQISEQALRRYWRKRWRRQHARLAWVNAQAEALGRVLRHTGESDEAVLARKLLLAQVLARLEDLKEVGIFDLLRETREMVKATRHLQSSAAAPRRPRSRAELRRRLREIYGWPEEKLNPETSGSGQAKADT